MTRTTNFRYGSFWIFYITCSAWTCNVNSLTASTLHGVMMWNNDKKHKSMTSVILWNTTFKFFFFLKKKRKEGRKEGGKEEWKKKNENYFLQAFGSQPESVENIWNKVSVKHSNFIITKIFHKKINFPLLATFLAFLPFLCLL